MSVASVAGGVHPILLVWPLGLDVHLAAVFQAAEARREAAGIQDAASRLFEAAFRDDGRGEDEAFPADLRRTPLGFRGSRET